MTWVKFDPCITQVINRAEKAQNLRHKQGQGLIAWEPRANFSISSKPLDPLMIHCNYRNSRVPRNPAGGRKLLLTQALIYLRACSCGDKWLTNVCDRSPSSRCLCSAKVDMAWQSVWCSFQWFAWDGLLQYLTALQLPHCLKGNHPLFSYRTDRNGTWLPRLHPVRCMQPPLVSRTTPFSTSSCKVISPATFETVFTSLYTGWITCIALATYKLWLVNLPISFISLWGAVGLIKRLL